MKRGVEPNNGTTIVTPTSSRAINSESFPTATIAALKIKKIRDILSTGLRWRRVLKEMRTITCAAVANRYETSTLTNGEPDWRIPTLAIRGDMPNIKAVKKAKIIPLTYSDRLSV